MPKYLMEYKPEPWTKSPPERRQQCERLPRCGRIVEIPNGLSSDDWGKLQSDFAKESGALPDDWPYATTWSLVDWEVTENGVRYNSELAGPGGASFVLFKFPDTTKEQLREAAAEIRRKDDVVRMSVLRIHRMI